MIQFFRQLFRTLTGRPKRNDDGAGGETERQLSNDEQLVMALTSKILEGEASQDEVDQLEAITQSNEKLRKSHQEVVDIDRMLREHCQEGTIPSGE